MSASRAKVDAPQQRSALPSAAAAGGRLNAWLPQCHSHSGFHSWFPRRAHRHPRAPSSRGIRAGAPCTPAGSAQPAASANGERGSKANGSCRRSSGAAAPLRTPPVVGAAGPRRAAARVDEHRDVRAAQQRASLTRQGPQRAGVRAARGVEGEAELAAGREAVQELSPPAPALASVSAGRTARGAPSAAGRRRARSGRSGERA